MNLDSSCQGFKAWIFLAQGQDRIAISSESQLVETGISGVAPFIYLSKGSASQIKSLFKQIHLKVPSYEWKYLLLTGDFNVNISKDSANKRLLEIFVKQFGADITWE